MKAGLRKLTEEQKLTHFKRSQCQSDVGLATQRWRSFVNQDCRCRLVALYMYNGKKLCERHLGSVLIAEALGELGAGLETQKE